MKKKKNKLPDFHAILGRLGRARAIIETAHRALARDNDSDEVWTLRTGLDFLRAVYNELDLAIGHLPSEEMRRENGDD